MNPFSLEFSVPFDNTGHRVPVQVQNDSAVQALGHIPSNTQGESLLKRIWDLSVMLRNLHPELCVFKLRTVFYDRLT